MVDAIEVVVGVNVGEASRRVVNAVRHSHSVTQHFISTYVLYLHEIDFSYIDLSLVNC